MLEHQFFELYLAYGQPQGMTVEITITELTGLWQCSERNVKMGMMNHEHVILFLLFKELQTLYNPSVRGVSVNSLGWIDFKDIWLQSV
ncbi:hypothetical protein ACFQI7_01885 [Paenibacillus allorhizosphaerae]|uniref:Uncharacterized protein n=1 Tax=Paenibacillus allorhizosphaerae TaxID=2849866 RepID=A0ABM8VAL7_9BACL|nr:hypothetical protein [Paenibacillus allorhizosphaerae]CAG7616871.1 hypothetical protein PAECIP111802_00337 [Paenibacillus allorhizosphaerae]